MLENEGGHGSGGRVCARPTGPAGGDLRNGLRKLQRVDRTDRESRAQAANHDGAQNRCVDRETRQHVAAGDQSHSMDHGNSDSDQDQRQPEAE